MKKILTFLTVLACMCSYLSAGNSMQPQSAPDLAGAWSGKLTAGPVSMNIVFNFSKDQSGSTVCTFDSPDQGVKGIPVEVMRLSSDSLEVSIPSIGASYAGRFIKAGQDGHVISTEGVFSQLGQRFPVNLTYGRPIILRPQTPVAPFPYKTEEVTFTSGDITLAGTLSYPTGFEKSASGSVPVVLLVTGSGQQNRDEEIFSHKPFLVIADYFARNGIATLRYDDRGVGQSAGDPASVTLQSNMADAKAGIDYLRSLGKFGKVGVMGHSEGGTIAFMLGAEGDVDFLVSLAGAAVSGKDILLDQNRTALLQAGMPEVMADDYCTLLGEVLDYRIDHADGTRNPEYVVDSLSKSSGATLPGAALENLATVLSQASPWIDSFISYDPSAALAQIHCPAYAANGSLDTQVNPVMNLDAVKAHLPENPSSVVKEYPGLNHLFQHCKTGSATEYGQIIETFSREVLKDLSEWVNDL